MGDLLFDGWGSIGRIFIVAILSYGALLVILRSSGKRSIAKLNAYDLIVTVALGSTLSAAITSDSVSVADAAAAFLVLVGLQFVLTWLSVRTRVFRDIVTGEPTVLLYRGEPLRKAMLRQRVTDAEVHAAVRQAGFGSLSEVQAVVFETDGTLSVVSSSGEIVPGDRV